jgi:hypothetical protein
MTWSPMGLHMHPANIQVYICTQLKQSKTARHWQLFTHWTDIYGRQEKSVRCEKCITPIDADYNNLLHSVFQNFHGPVLNMHEVIYGSWDNAANISHCTPRDMYKLFSITFVTALTSLQNTVKNITSLNDSSK